MKATLKGKIISVQNTEGDSILTFKSTGKVDKEVLPEKERDPKPPADGALAGRA